MVIPPFYAAHSRRRRSPGEPHGPESTLPSVVRVVACERSPDSAVSEAQRNAKYVYGKEVKFRIESALDVLGFAKTMLLPREQKVSNRHTILAQLLHHRFGLVGRHDRVF